MSYELLTPNLLQKALSSRPTPYTLHSTPKTKFTPKNQHRILGIRLATYDHVRGGEITKILY